MGEARVRQQTDPLYGVIGKGARDSPQWAVVDGVLLLEGRGGDIVFLPASKMVTLNEEQLEAVRAILADNPQLTDTTSIDVVESTHT